MNSTTLRGVFPAPKPVYRKNFLRENIRNIRQIQEMSEASHSNLRPKRTPLKATPPRTANTEKNLRKISTSDGTAKSEMKKTQSKSKKTRSIEPKIVDSSMQTEEDLKKLYLNGVIKYPSPSVLEKLGNKQNKSPKFTGEGDILEKKMQNLNLEEKHNLLRENIRNQRLKLKNEKSIAKPNTPFNYQKGVVPEYIQKRKEEMKNNSQKMSKDSIPGLVLLPEEERKEYLRVARENYADLIRELNAMPIRNDTLKRRNRKIEIEQELKKIDEVIKIFQKPKVFVKADE